MSVTLGLGELKIKAHQLGARNPRGYGLGDGFLVSSATFTLESRAEP